MSTAISAIGVDGGTTKTHLAAVDADGKIICFNECGSTNAYESDDITHNLVDLFGPVHNAVIDVAVFTLAGWDFEKDQKNVRQQVEKALSVCNIVIRKAIYENDIFAVYYSGIGESSCGVAIAAGSGVVGAAVNGTEKFRTTGFGYIAGEWGAGWELADYAIHLVCSSLLEREEYYPVLIEKAFHYFNASSYEELVEAVIHKYTITHRGFFLKEVYDAYLQNCAGAKKVFKKGSRELARTIAALLKKISNENVPVILGGSVFKSIGLLPGLKECVKEITKADPEFRLIKSDPVWGALYWAAREAGLTTTAIAKNILVNCTR